MLQPGKPEKDLKPVCWIIDDPVEVHKIQLIYPAASPTVKSFPALMDERFGNARFAAA
jgi:hypothetical protein